MTRQVFLLDISDLALADEYEAWHQPGQVPAQVLADIKASGIAVMEIYRSGERLVMVTEASSDTPASGRALSQESRDWEAKMDRYQQPLPWASGLKWHPADRIFDSRQHSKDDQI